MVVVACTVALVLSACTAPAPNPTFTPRETASPTPTRPVPEAGAEAPAVPAPQPDPLARVQSIVARPDVLELRDEDDSVIVTLSYMGQPSEAIVTLSTVLGGPPVSEPYDGGNHRPDGVMHTWDGFVLDERFYDEQRRAEQFFDYLIWPRFAVYFDTPEARGKTLASVQGIQAGDSWASASSSPDFKSELYTCVGTPVDTFALVDPEGNDATATVVVTESDEGGTVKWVGAPEMVATGCA